MQEIWKRLRLIDWALLALTAACQAAWVGNSQTDDNLYKISFALILLAAIIVSYIPNEKNDRLRIAALILQSLCIAGAMATGAFRLFGLLFLILSFRSALLFERKPAAFSVIGIYLLHLMAQMTSLHFITAGLHKSVLRVETHPTVIIEQQLYEITSLAIAALLARTFLSERRARRQAQQLTKEVEGMAVAVERGRIARDIHDTLGHSLTALNVQLEVTEKLLQNGDLQKTGDSLKESRTLVSSAIKDVRKSVQSIKADDFSLGEAVGAIAERLSQSKQMDINLAIDDGSLSVASRHNLLLVIKECLTNVQKHAHASAVEIKLAPNGPSAELVVKDNGRGFSLHDDSDGFGIKGMRERVLALGRTFDIQTSPGSGTRISISVPNSAQESHLYWL